MCKVVAYKIDDYEKIKTPLMTREKQIIEVKGTAITIIQLNQSDYISLTNIARYKNPNEPKDVVKNWMRSKTTIEFLGLWEKLHNPGFKGVEFDAFIREAGSGKSGAFNAHFPK